MVPSVGNTANSLEVVVYWIALSPSLSVALTSPIRTPMPVFSLAVKSRARGDKTEHPTHRPARELKW